MPRRERDPHQLTLRMNKGRAVVWYRGRSWDFGRWGDGGPTPEALAAFQRQVAAWARGHGAEVVPSLGLLVEVWAEWVRSGAAGDDPNGLRRTCEGLLFGTPRSPGRHASTPVARFGTPELAAFQDRLCREADGDDDGVRDRRRFGRDAVARFVGYVRRCYRWAAQRGLATAEQCYALSLVDPPPPGAVREPKKRRGVLWQTVAAVLPHLTPPVRAAAELLWLSCARPSELLTLRAGDVKTSGVILPVGGVPLDLDKLGVWAAVKEEWKEDDGDYDRVLFFGPQARRVLAPLMDRPPETHLFRPAEAVRRGKPGECYTHGPLTRALRRACRRAGVPEFTAYQLRHACFKRVQAEYGRDAARVYGGHTVGGATEGYAGKDLHTAAKVAKEMG